MNIYISGLYSGTNPQPGLGMVRSLRQAFPKACLIGLDYSIRCSGIHWHELDDVRIQRPWHELDLDLHARTMQEMLDAGDYYLSGNDLEIMWLASVFPEGHPCLLAPPPGALQQVSKPAVTGFSHLPLRIPPYISTQAPDFELHAFCRRHNWKVWLKGPYYEAIFCPNWPAVNAARQLLGKAWHTEKLVLQAHVSGYEESVCLAAYRGQLLDCVQMRKRDLTEIGKTWAGDINDVVPEILEPLREAIKKMNWTGGAELEMLRDASGQRWLLECNPRFPAWIHGASLAGRNLVARLVSAASGIAPQPMETAPSHEFTRVVVELPVNPGLPLHALAEPFAGAIGHNMKHPSGLLDFARKLHHREQAAAPEQTTSGTFPTPVPQTYLTDLLATDTSRLDTPCFLFLKQTATSTFEEAQSCVQQFSTPSLQFRLAYSIKTNPDKRLLQAALQAGFMAEAISAPEVAAALAAGFRADQIILNGPGKWWRKELLPAETLHAVFCDSIADLKRVAAAIAAGTLKAGTIGVRLRSPALPSRFGIPVSEPDDFESLLDAIALLPQDIRFGIHFHMASSQIGVAAWESLMATVVYWCQNIEALTGRRVSCLDLGGGWAPEDWALLTSKRFAGAAAYLQERLPYLEEVLSEPGKAMAEPCMALAMRVLEAMPPAREDAEREVVVDGSVAELPMHYLQPHRILCQDAGGQWQALGRGKTNLLGRLCMEHDVVASQIALPENVTPGQLLVICDAGAYDKSMSYVFGNG